MITFIWKNIESRRHKDYEILSIITIPYLNSILQTEYQITCTVKIVDLRQIVSILVKCSIFKGVDLCTGLQWLSIYVQSILVQ